MTEDKNNVDEMEEKLEHLLRERITDLTKTASLLGSWMSDQRLTLAEQLTVVELLRASLLVNYMERVRTSSVEKFVSEHPNLRVVVVDGSKKPSSTPPRTFKPSES